VRNAGLLDEPVSNDETESGVSGRTDDAINGGSGLICCSSSVESGLMDSIKSSHKAGESNALFNAFYSQTQKTDFFQILSIYLNA